MFAQLSTRETSGKAALTRVRGVLRRLYERQELKRLSTLPRYQPTCTRLLGKPVHLADAPSFLVSFYEIFGRQLYRFSPRRERPTILDCGANIGVAILYWKQAFPEAEIVAFEPDPAL